MRLPQLWPGIWRVSQILTGFNELRFDLNEPIKKSGRVLLFCDRLVNELWKRSFSHNHCEASYAVPLSADEVSRLNLLLSTDRKLREAFAKYQAAPHPIDLVANISLGDLPDGGVKRLQSECEKALNPHIENGLRIDDILNFLRESELDRHQRNYPIQATLQLICSNYELNGGDFVFRSYRVLGS